MLQPIAIPVTPPDGREPLPRADITTTKYNMTKHEAQRLARQIRTYWFTRGYDNVQVWIEHDPNVREAVEYRVKNEEFGVDPHWTVRSNLVNGMPPGKQMHDGYERD